MSLREILWIYCTDRGALIEVRKEEITGKVKVRGLLGVLASAIELYSTHG